MDLPQSVEELKLYISNRVQESLHLDYKASDSLNDKARNEIAKDVSAFANSDGGIIIYGIREDNHLPTEIDGGADHSRYTKEWLEQVIVSNISPKIDGLLIHAIPISDTHSAYAVGIPKSYRGPHQERTSHRYYRRYNFASAPMEDYEINDVRNRTLGVSPLVYFDVEFKHGIIIYFVISNIGKSVAHNVTFKFTPNLPWRNKSDEPPALKNGIIFFPPGRVFKFMYETFIEVAKQGSEIPNQFSIQIEYDHPLVSQRLSEIFHVNLLDYMQSEVIESDLYEHAKKMEVGFRELSHQVKSLTSAAKELLTLAGPTGLHLSISTWRNLRHLTSGKDELEKLDPNCLGYNVFEEVLGVHRDMALQLERHFKFHEGRPLSHIDGITPEIIERLKRHFKISEE